MELKLTTWQRVIVFNILGAIEGNVATISKAGKLYELFQLSEEEQSKVGFRALPGGQFSWQNADEKWELTIEDKALVDFLKSKVEAYDRWPAAQVSQVLDLFEQLGAKIPD